MSPAKRFAFTALALAAVIFTALLRSSYPSLEKWIEMRRAPQPKSGVERMAEACSQASIPGISQTTCKSNADCKIVHALCGCKSINTKSVDAYLLTIKEKCTDTKALAGCLAVIDPLCSSHPVCQSGVCGPKSVFDR